MKPNQKYYIQKILKSESIGDKIELTLSPVGVEYTVISNEISTQFREGLENLSHSQKLFDVLHDMGFIAVESETREIVNAMIDDIIRIYNEVHK